MSKQKDSGNTQEAPKKEAPKKLGNIDFLQNFATLSKEENNVIGQIFDPPPEPGINGKPSKVKHLGREEMLHFGLGVEKKDLPAIYDKDYDLKKYKETKKYYKDEKGQIQDYNNGQELKEKGEEISTLLSNLGAKYGDKHYTYAFKEEMSQALGAEFKKLGKLSGAMLTESYSQANDEINKEIDNKIHETLKDIRNNPEFDKPGNEALKSRLNKISAPQEWKNNRALSLTPFVKAMLNDPEMENPDNTKLKTNISEFIRRLEEDNKAVQTGGGGNTKFAELINEFSSNSELNNSPYGETIQKTLEGFKNDINTADPQNFRDNAQDFAKACEEQGLFDNGSKLSSSLKKLKLQAEHYSFPLVEKKYGGQYSQMLEKTGDILSALQQIERRLENQPTINHGTSVTITGVKPDHEGYIKAITKLVLEQKQITGLDPNSENFKDDLSKIDPKKLGKIEVAFEQDNGVVAYKIKAKDFINILQKMDSALIKEMDPEYIKKNNPGLVNKESGVIYDRELRPAVNEGLKKAAISEQSLANSFVKRDQQNIAKTLEKAKRQSAYIPAGLVDSQNLQVSKKNTIPIDAANIMFPQDVSNSVEAERAKDIEKLSHSQEQRRDPISMGGHRQKKELAAEGQVAPEGKQQEAANPPKTPTIDNVNKPEVPQQSFPNSPARPQTSTPATTHNDDELTKLIDSLGSGGGPQVKEQNQAPSEELMPKQPTPKSTIDYDEVSKLIEGLAGGGIKPEKAPRQASEPSARPLPPIPAQIDQPEQSPVKSQVPNEAPKEQNAAEVSLNKLSQFLNQNKEAVKAQEPQEAPKEQKHETLNNNEIDQMTAALNKFDTEVSVNKLAQVINQYEEKVKARGPHETTEGQKHDASQPLAELIPSNPVKEVVNKQLGAVAPVKENTNKDLEMQQQEATKPSGRPLPPTPLSSTLNLEALDELDKALKGFDNDARQAKAEAQKQASPVSQEGVKSSALEAPNQQEKHGPVPNYTSALSTSNNKRGMFENAIDKVLGEGTYQNLEKTYRNLKKIDFKKEINNIRTDIERALNDPKIDTKNIRHDIKSINPMKDIKNAVNLIGIEVKGEVDKLNNNKISAALIEKAREMRSKIKGEEQGARNSNKGPKKGKSSDHSI